MPAPRLRRLIPALLLLTAIYVAFKRSSLDISRNDDDSKTTSAERDAFDIDSESYVEGQFVRRVVAVGDLHGDYPNALKVLQMSHVVDSQGNWTGDVDFFVQTGDIIDRYVVVIFSW